MHQRLFLLFVTFISLIFLMTTGGFLLGGTSFPSDVLSILEIKELVAGKTAEITYNKKPGKGLLYFSLDGEVQQLKNNWLEKGNWRVNEKDRLCVEFSGEKWTCRMLIRNKDGIGQYIAKNDGNHQLELTYENFIAGNKLFELSESFEPPLEKLDKDAIIKLFSDKTVESETVRKGRVSLTYYYPDGTLELQRNGKTYSGTWRVRDDDRMCLKIENSQEKCRIIVKQGTLYGKYIVKNNGRHQQSITYRRFMSGKQF
jgi:hypothetical protein